jgi:hypothetical protein
MIGKLAVAAVVLLGGGLALTSMSRPIGGAPIPPKVPVPPTPSPTPSPIPTKPLVAGQTVSNAIDVDSILATSPILSSPPAIGQIVQVAAVDPFSLDEGASIPVQGIAQAILGSGRIVAYVSKATLDWLSEEVPALESKLPPTAYTSGVYVSFSPDRVWALGGWATPAPPGNAPPSTGSAPKANFTGAYTPPPGWTIVDWGYAGNPEVAPLALRLKNLSTGKYMCIAFPSYDDVGPPSVIDCGIFTPANYAHTP